MRATVLPGGEVSKAEGVGAELPMGLGRAGLEAVKTWRFAPSDAEHEEEIVLEFRLAGDCDPEPPPFERIGEHRFRVWAKPAILRETEAPKCASAPFDHGLTFRRRYFST